MQSISVNVVLNYMCQMCVCVRKRESLCTICVQMLLRERAARTVGRPSDRPVFLIDRGIPDRRVSHARADRSGVLAALIHPAEPGENGRIWAKFRTVRSGPKRSWTGFKHLENSGANVWFAVHDESVNLGPQMRIMDVVELQPGMTKTEGLLMFCDGPNGSSRHCVNQSYTADGARFPWPCWSSDSRARPLLPELWSEASAYGGQASTRGHANEATWTLETLLSISTVAWEDTCETELCPLCGCGKRERHPQIIYQRQVAKKKSQIPAQNLQARIKMEVRPKIVSAASLLLYLSSLFHHRPPSLIQIIHASS